MHIHTIQLNIERVIGGTSHMDATEFGAYMSLIICCYQKKNKLPSDENRLARMAKCSLKQWNRVRETVSEKFTEIDGYWCHLGIQSEIDKYERLSSKNKSNRLKNKEIEKPKDNFGGTNTNNNNQITNNNIKEDTNVSSKKTTGSKVGRRIPDDWELSQELGEWAEEKGFTGQQIMVEAEKFKNYWTAKSGSKGVKTNWDATWRTWILNAMEYRK